MKKLSKKEIKRRLLVKEKARKFAKTYVGPYETDTICKNTLMVIVSIVWQAGYEKGRYER